MKITTRFLALFLLLLMLVSAVGCANGTSDETTPDTTAVVGSGESSASDETTQDPALIPNLSDKVFNRTFTIASGYVTDTKYTSTLIVSDETTGETINDAVFARTVLLEDKYKIDIIVEDVKPDAVIKVHTSGERTYDIGTATLSEMTSVLQKGTANDLKTVESIELEKPWWDQNANARFATGSKLYYTFSDFFITGIDNSRACFFNKQLAEDLNLGNLYQIAKDGTWTVELFHEMSLKALSDLNGDGKYDSNDRVGIAEAATQFYEVLLTGCDMEVVQQGSNNIPFYSPAEKSTEFTEVYIKLLDLFTKDNNYLNIGNTTAVDMFRGGNSLFILYSLAECPKIRKNSEIEFGIMPVPKYTADQKEYLHVSPNGDALYIVEGNEEEVEYAGAILEAAAYYSSSYYSDNALMPSYFDLCLATKNAPDMDSSENLQLIHDSISYTVKVLGTGYMQSIYDNFSAKNYNISSLLKQNNKIYVKQIDDMMAAIGVTVE